jgi:hypothetical protein
MTVIQIQLDQRDSVPVQQEIGRLAPLVYSWKVIYLEKLLSCTYFSYFFDLLWILPGKWKLHSKFSFLLK